jgi:hypothetical protein
MFRVERKTKQLNFFKPRTTQKIERTPMAKFAKKLWLSRRARAGILVAVFAIGGYFTWTHGRLVPMSADAILAAQTSSPLPPEWLQRYFGKNYCTRQDYCGPNADPDHDNLTNYEEFLYYTDPANPDTDKDGTQDGVEVRNLTNPASATLDSSKRDINNIYDYNPLTDEILQQGLDEIKTGDVMSFDQIQAAASRLTTMPDFKEIPFKVALTTDAASVAKYVDIIKKIVADQSQNQYASIGQTITDVTDQSTVQSFNEAMQYYATTLVYVDVPLDVAAFHKAYYASLVFEGLTGETQMDLLQGKISDDDARDKFRIYAVYYTRAIQDMNSAAKELQKKYTFDLTVN